MISPFYWKNKVIKVALYKINRIWWKMFPGVQIKARWPVGPVKSIPVLCGTETIYLESADPNDHYRPELEQLVGRQGFDWDWSLEEGDIRDNTLTIKFRRGKCDHALYFALKWS